MSEFTPPEKKIRVIITDDHDLLRKSIRALLEKEDDIEVVAEAENGREAIELVQQLHPDIILLDITMPDLGGLEVAAAVKALSVKVIIVSMHTRVSFIRQAMKQNVQGYIAKSALKEVVSAIRAINTGKTYFSVPVSQKAQLVS